MILVHATGFHGRVWGPLADQLEGASAIAVDLPGHGETPVATGDDLSWERAGRRLLATIDEMGIEGAVGVGHSMGGAVLLLAEQERPGTFAGLYLYEPVAFPTHLGLGPDDNPLAAGALRRRRSFPSRRAAFENFSGKPPLDVLDPAVLRAYVEHGFRPVAATASGADDHKAVELVCPPEVESQSYRMGLVHPAFDRLATVGCPTVVARGRVEEMSPSTLAGRIARTLPSGRLEVFEDLGHFGPLEDPAGLASSVGTFLRDEIGLADGSP